MKLVSVNVPMPKVIDHLGRTVSTGIYNEPVAGRVMVHKLNVEEGEVGAGDLIEQVEAGPEKIAV